MNRFVAFSLSFAVKDILTGRVPQDAVEYVVPNFRWPGLDSWLDDGEPFDRYMESYWGRYADRDTVLQLLTDLRFKSVSHQFNISQGYWWPAHGCADLDIVLTNDDLRFTTDEVVQLLPLSKEVVMYAAIGKPIVIQEARAMRLEELKKVRLDPA